MDETRDQAKEQTVEEQGVQVPSGEEAATGDVGLQLADPDRQPDDPEQQPGDPDPQPDDGGAAVFKVIKRASTLKGVAIGRDVFLRRALATTCSPDVVEAAVATAPQRAGVSPQVIDDLASTAIRVETSKVTGLSALSGVPGGLAMIGTIPADLLQYFAHILRLEQKLAYLYGWPSFLNDDGTMDDEALSCLILLMGVMLQAEGVNGALAALVTTQDEVAPLEREDRAVMSNVLVHSAIESIMRVVDAKIVRGSLKGVVAKGVPVIGGAVSGGLTYASFRPGAARLKRCLRVLPAATGEQLSQEDVLAVLVRADEESGGKKAEDIQAAAMRAGEKVGAAVVGVRRGIGSITGKVAGLRKHGRPTGSVSDVEEELRHLKALLDEGVITQEDFDAKKRALLEI